MTKSYTSDCARDSARARLARRKWLAKQQANTTFAHRLSPAKLERRAEMAQYQQTAVDTIAFAMAVGEPVPVYCIKSGALIMQIPAPLLALNEHIGADIRTSGWLDRHVHPAWFNTSPEQLRELQRTVPAQYAVYCLGELYDWNHSTRAVLKDEKAKAQFDKWVDAHTAEVSAAAGIEFNGFGRARAQAVMPAAQRHEVLIAIESAPLTAQCDLAELLRVALALAGRLPSRFSILPDFAILFRDGVTDFANAIYAYLSEAIKTAIIRRAVECEHKARVITRADIENISLSVGRPQFREARMGKASDDTLFLDLADIFANDAQLELAMSRAARRPAKPEPRLSGKVYDAPAQEIKLAFSAMLGVSESAVDAVVPTRRIVQSVAPELRLNLNGNHVAIAADMTADAPRFRLNVSTTTTKE